MSLDVYLTVRDREPEPARQAIFIRRDGGTVEISRAEWDEMRPGIEPVMATINQGDGDETKVYSANITHNLGKMAEAAGIYQTLWRPEELGFTIAGELIQPLERGLAKLRATPAEFRRLNPENGWGTYEGLVSFVDLYLDACRQFPQAEVRSCR